jgi:hypothetical protein
MDQINRSKNPFPAGKPVIIKVSVEIKYEGNGQAHDKYKHVHIYIFFIPTFHFIPCP